MSDTPQEQPSTTCDPSQQKPSEIQTELRNLIYAMKHDPTLQGMVCMGEDGVLRSFDADRNIVDAVPLRPELITAYFEPTPPEELDKYEVTKGVDGRDVPEEQWFHPPKELIPAPLAEEHRERDPEKLEKYRQMYYEDRAKLVEEGLIKPEARETA